jgi:hypothetical protein
MAITTKERQESRLQIGVRRHLARLGEQAAPADVVLSRLPCRPEELDQLGIHPVVDAEGSGQVPAVHDQVGTGRA